VLISLINEYDRDGTITLEVDGITITRDDASDVYANMDGSTPMAGGDGGTMRELQTPTGNIAGQVSIDFDCDPISGSTFPIGETTVECTATDSAGNRGLGVLS
jgi:HYR domain